VSDYGNGTYRIFELDVTQEKKGGKTSRLFSLGFLLWKNKTKNCKDGAFISYFDRDSGQFRPGFNVVVFYFLNSHCSFGRISAISSMRGVDRFSHDLGPSFTSDLVFL
jgi:hypothetical protein